MPSLEQRPRGATDRHVHAVAAAPAAADAQAAPNGDAPAADLHGTVATLREERAVNLKLLAHCARFIEELEAELARRTHQAQAHTEAMDKQRAVWLESQNALAAAHAALNAQNAQLLQAHDTACARLAEVQAAQAALAAQQAFFTQSRSWRVTAPLRRLKSLLRRT